MDLSSLAFFYNQDKLYSPFTTRICSARFSAHLRFACVPSLPNYVIKSDYHHCFFKKREWEEEEEGVGGGGRGGEGIGEEEKKNRLDLKCHAGHILHATNL